MLCYIVKAWLIVVQYTFKLSFNLLYPSLSCLLIIILFKWLLYQNKKMITNWIIDRIAISGTCRLTDSQTDRLTDFLTDRLTDIKTHRQIQLQTDRLIGWYIIELTNQYTNKIIDWQNYRQKKWLIDYTSHLQIVWLSNLCIHFPVETSMNWMTHYLICDWL